MHGDRADWSIGEHLTASVVDELRMFRYEHAVKGVPKGKRRGMKPPKLVPRPGVDAKGDGLRFGDAKKTPAEMRAVLDQWTGRG